MGKIINFISRKNTLKRTRSFHSILLSHDSAIAMNDEHHPENEGRITDSYLRETPNNHANGKSSLARSTGSKPVNLRRACSQSAKKRKMDGSQTDSAPKKREKGL